MEPEELSRSGTSSGRDSLNELCGAGTPDNNERSVSLRILISPPNMLDLSAITSTSLQNIIALDQLLVS